MRRDPFAATPSQAPINALEYFTDREGFIEAFDRHRNLPEGLDVSVLVFYGVGGIGKTTLLRKLSADLSQLAAPIPHVRYNLENVTDQAQAYRDVLMRLRSDLESEYHLKFPQFDLALSVLIAQEGGQRPPLVKVSPGLNSVFEAAMEFTPSIIKASFKFASSQLRSAVKNSETLENWVRQVGGTEAILELSERFAQDDQIVQDELIRRFAQDLASNLPERPGRACRGVIFFDTYEALWTGRENSQAAQARLLDAWVRLMTEYLLGAGVLLVIAGRDRLTWGDGDPDWEACLDQHLLGGVSAHDAQAFLAKRGIGVAPPLAPDALQSAILRCADTSAGSGAPPSCHLLSLALSADIVLNTRHAGTEPSPALFRGVPPAKMASELATRFLKSLHNRNLELWVEALSLTPRFDDAAALALETERQLHTGRAGWEQLRHYSFMTAQTSGFFRMHRTMREVLRGRTPDDVVLTLHAWFESYWRGRGEEGLAFYHHWCRNPEAALTAWAAEHQAAADALNSGEARVLLTRGAEIALDEDDRYLLSDELWAKTHAALGKALRATVQIPRAARLSGAMQHYRSALSVFTEDAYPDEWAQAQSSLGTCHLNLPTGDRVENLRLAREHLASASRMWTEVSEPMKWANLQVELGLTYAYLPTGDKATNLQTAADYFESTLRVWTKGDFPDRWAQIQNNVGCTALLMPDDIAANLRRAIACFDAVLDVQTETAHPELWAKAHHNLGIVYWNLPDGDRVENLRLSISHYAFALRVHTEEGQPDSWAETQNSLGCTWRELAESDGPSASDRAADHFRAAQRVWTKDDNPDRWAQAQCNLGEVYRKRLDGDRAEHLRTAISCFRDALQIHTEEAFPETWAKEQNDLGLALQAYASETGDTSVLDEVSGCFAAAARGYRSIGMTKEADQAERLGKAV